MDEDTNTDPILTGPRWPVFFRYALPSVAGLLALTTANIVDGIFIGQFAGADALAALNLLIPYFTLLFGLALMLAIGGTVRAGRYLGEGNTGAASAIFSKCLVTTLAISLAATLLCLVFHETVYRALGASPELFPLMSEYFLVIIWVMVIQLASMVLYYFVRVDGKPALATTALMTGAFANIALDALLVGVLDYGLTGAAFATGIAQIFQLLVLFRYWRSPSRRLQFRIRQSNWGEVRQAAANGVSEWINEVSVGLVLLLINWLMMASHGVAGVAAFTVINYLIFLSLMMFYGISDAMHVLISHNLGAGNARRVRDFMICGSTVIIGLSITLLGTLWLSGTGLIGLFLDDSAAAQRALAIEFLSVLWPLFLINGLNVLLSVYLTAMHQPLPSAAVALSRSLVLPAALLVLLARFAPDLPMLLALPIAEWLTFALAITLFLRYRPHRLIPAR